MRAAEIKTAPASRKISLTIKFSSNAKCVTTINPMPAAARKIERSLPCSQKYAGGRAAG
jgi:hypothetical protein